MARIFLSHSSQNNAAAIALRDWIIKGGWDDHPFLDLDPERGIAAGERWERALHEEADRCEAVLFLVSHAWLRSDWCLKEFHLALKLNKRLFGVLIDDLPHSDLPTTLTTTWQIVNLASGADHELFRAVLPDLSKEEHVTFSRSGLARLKAGLDKAGLDPRFFIWPPEKDPDRSPYPGLRPLEAEDAGIFFGRDASMVVVLDRLRGLREAAPPRLLVILGASGAGKSSFLRAGLVPRLARDDANFLPLPIIRPEAAVITGTAGLIHSLQEVFKSHGHSFNRAEIANAINGGVSQLLSLLNRLAENARTPEMSGRTQPEPPSLVISIDQGEELFLPEGVKEAHDFLMLLKELTLVSAPNLIVLFTIRSDSYEQLQTAKALEGIRQETFALPPMPRGAYQTLIEGPALRLQDSKRPLKIEPALIQALLMDIETGGGKDALPLLAFTLERLYREYGADGDLLAKEYDALGRIRGSIQAAVDAALKAADADPTIPKESSERLALLRSAFIPALAGVDRETRAARRRVARISEIPQKARGLINCLVDARLLATDSPPGAGETIIEPAHEALLRQWDALEGWLKEDSVALLMLEGIWQAARDWADNDKSSDWLGHSAGRLEDAERLREREDFARFIGPVEQAYLQACRAQENERRNRELEEARKLAEAQTKIAQRTRIGLIVASVFLVAAISAAVFGFRQADKAEQQAVKTEQRSAVLAVNAARSLTDDGALDSALLLMLNGARWFNDASVPDEVRIAFSKALELKLRIEVNTLFPNMQVFETDAALLLVNPATNDIFKLTDSLSPPRLVEGSTADSPILALRQSAKGDDVIVLRKNLEVERINLETGVRGRVGVFPQPKAQPGRVYEKPDWSNDEAEITDSGLVVREFSYSSPGDKQGEYAQIMDSGTGQVVEGELPFSVSVYYGRGADGSVYVLQAGGEKKVFRLKPAGDGFLSQEVHMYKQAIQFRYGNCFGEMKDAVRAAALKEISDSEEEKGAAARQSICKKFGDEVLLTTFELGSAGNTRNDTQFKPDGAKNDVRKLFSQAVRGNLSLNNMSWVGMQAETRTIGALLNRDAMVADHQYGALLRLSYRHQTVPTRARFAGPNLLIVVEGESGWLVAHDLADIPRRREGSLLSTTTNDFIGSEKRVTTLHRGTCVGYAIPRDQVDVLPDGRKLVYEAPTMTSDSAKSEITVMSDKSVVVVQLPNNSRCLQFSANWRQMLVMQPNEVTLYDFDRVVASGSLTGSEIGAMPVSSPRSAFFVPGAGDVVTSDSDNRVLRWKREGNEGKWRSTELFRGEKPIIYAEPDTDGDRLLLIEVTGGSGMRGFLYSVRARQEWFDLGSDYKWLGIAFTDKQEVVVSKHDTWTNVFPVLPLSALVELANKELTPACRPVNQGDYKSSPCWPTSLE